MTRARLPVGIAVAIISFTASQASRAGIIQVPADQPTIAAAIIAAQPSDTIQIAPGLYQERLTVDKSLTFQGDPATPTFIEPDADGRVFTIASGVTVQMNDLTIQKGRMVDQGGGIRTEGALTLTRCTIRDNSANLLGGAIYGTAESSITLQQCRLENNVHVSSDFSSAGGAGIFAYGPVTATDSFFTGNNTLSAGGAILCVGELTVTRCLFTGNTARQWSAAIWGVGPKSTITDSVISENSGPGGPVSCTREAYVARCVFERNVCPQGWGALDVQGPATLEDCLFTGNKGMQGGAVRASASVVMRNCTFVQNEASDLGGAMILRSFNAPSTYTIEDCTFIGNISNRIGGAIMGIRSTINLARCRFEENRAAAQGGAMNTEECRTSVVDSIIDNNRTGINGIGGALTNSSFTEGIPAALILERCSITGNVSGGYSGAIQNQNGQVELTDCDLSGNTAEVPGLGGAMINQKGPISMLSTVRMVRCRVLNNTAANNAGAIWNSDGKLTMEACTVAGNRALNTSRGDGFGGAFCVLSFDSATPTEVDLSRCTVSGNTAGQVGGAFFNQDATVRLVNCTLSGNRAEGPGYGGAVLNQSMAAARPATMTLVNCTVANNTSTTLNGGGIVTGTEAGPATTRLKNTILADNTVPSLSASLGGVNVSEGHNISTDAPEALSDPTDRTNTDPMLGPLADNGGLTLTHALLPGSPAIDTGTADGAPGIDQRGAARPAGAGVDIGSVEAGALAWSLQDASRALRIAGGMESATAEDMARLDLAPGAPNGITTEDAGVILRRVLGLN